jgi:glycosyltransferase involved in cell wall biosynthesis
MRILMINTLYPPVTVGGAEKSVCLLAEALARSGDQVAVVSLHPEPQEIVESRNNVRVYRLPMDNRYWPFDGGEKPGKAARLLWHMGEVWNLRAAERVGRILDMERPDVVHSNNLCGFSVSVWREVKKRKIRLVHTLRDYYLLCSRSALFREGSVCVQRCRDCKALTANRRPASQLVDAVVSISEYVLNCHTHNKYFSGAPSAVIYNIGGTNTMPSPGRYREDTLVFGCIGRLEDEKGIRVVLEATQRLSMSNWRLRIAGVGLDEYVTALKQRFTDPRIEWLGFASPQQFYASIDVTIVSSVWPEPLSRIVIETFASGKSAICAQSGGIPEIANMGRVVATYPAKDSQLLAQLMDQAMLNPDLWRSGGFRNANAESLFEDRSISASYRSVYQGDMKSAGFIDLPETFKTDLSESVGLSTVDQPVTSALDAAQGFRG